MTAKNSTKSPRNARAASSPKTPTKLASATPSPAPAGTVTYVAPEKLALAQNIRSQLHLAAEFVASVEAHGVQVPVLAAYDPLGQVLVWDGQRRVKAALAAGLTRVPVVITDAPGDEVDRIVTQDTVNHHRAGLSALDQAAVYEQLAAFGLSADAIARRTARPRADVSAGLRVAASSAAAGAAEVAPLDLTRLARLTEVEDDPEVVEELTELAAQDVGEFDHALERALQDRERRRLTALAVAQLNTRGVTVIDERPGYGDKAVLRDYQVGDAEGNQISEADHEACPGHAVYIIRVDGSASEGLEIRSDWYCMDFKAYGHRDRFSSRTPTEQLSDEEREAARQERARTKELNADSVASSVVRGRFLGELFQRKALPADAVHVAIRLHALTHNFSGGSEWELLGSKQISWWDTSALLKRLATPAQAERWLLARAIADIEHTMTGNNKAYWKINDSRRALYLKALESWGYTLSRVEYLHAYGKEPAGQVAS